MTEYKRKHNTTCSICDTPIYRRPAEIKQSREGLFCSQACYGISCRKEKPCIICGTLILAGANKKTCGRACANKHRIGIQYKINRPKDNAVGQKSLKLQLLKYRGKKCERCDYKKYQILQIHHKNKNRKDNGLKNLELLCPNCHMEIHYLK